MKTILIIVLLMSGIWLQAQTTTHVWHIPNQSGQDSVVFKMIEKGDTIFHYKGNDLVFIQVKKGTTEYSYRVEKGIKKLVWWSETKTESALIKDGRCNGLKSDGTRCTRTVKTGIFYCWQHD